MRESDLPVAYEERERCQEDNVRLCSQDWRAINWIWIVE